MFCVNWSIISAVTLNIESLLSDFKRNFKINIIKSIHNKYFLGVKLIKSYFYVYFIYSIFQKIKHYWDFLQMHTYSIHFVSRSINKTSGMLTSLEDSLENYPNNVG